ncbi:MAG TPA: C39 family peptidase, partial [Chloroflexota bacterium]|nr:C39 family peptidase [Chloroflexota bacterium]
MRSRPGGPLAGLAVLAGLCVLFFTGGVRTLWQVLPTSPAGRRARTGATAGARVTRRQYRSASDGAFGPILLVLGLTVLALRATLRVRILAGGTLAVVVVTFGAAFAPPSVRRLPVVNRVYTAVDRVPLPWKPELPAHVPAPALVGVSLGPGGSYGAGAPDLGQGLGQERVDPGSSPAAVTNAPVVPVALPASALPALPDAVKLEGFRHQWQTWNNCGPATITMATSFYGRKETQTEAQRFLKPNPEDKNVRPDELVSYVRSLGLEAEWRLGGDLQRLKQLLANKIPVVVEVWIAPEPGDWMGHYRLLVGYDDKAGRFIAYDSVKAPGLNLQQPYAQFDDDWRIFNRTYVPVYTKEQAPLVERIIGQDRDDQTMYERALAVARREVLSLPESGFAWFNLGSSLTALGRTAEAVQAFDKARTLKLPWRMLWYQFAPFEAYLAEGRVQDVLALTEANLRRASDLEESHYYRGRALQA